MPIRARRKVIRSSFTSNLDDSVNNVYLRTALERDQEIFGDVTTK